MSANLNNVPQSILTPENSIPESVPQTAPSETAASPRPIDDKLTSTRFAHLSKKEAALVREREAFKQERESFKREQEEIGKYKQAWTMVNEIAELQKVDEIAAMKKAGFSDTAVMNFLAQNQENVSPEEKALKIAKGEIEKFKTEQQKQFDEQNKRQAEAQKLNEDRTIMKFKNDIKSHIATASEKYEYCAHYGEAAQELVYETISSILADSNEMISIDEASQLVEDFYEEQDKAMNSLKKRGVHRAVNPPESVQQVMETTTKSAMQMPKQGAQRVESKQFVDNRTPVKTLNNKMNANVANTVSQNLTPEQNKQQVIDKYLSMMRR